MFQTKRVLAIGIGHVLGMCALGYVACIISIASNEPLVIFGGGFLVVVFLVTPLILLYTGAFGLLTAPVSVIVLRRTNYKLALVLIYCFAAIPTAYVAWTSPTYLGEKAAIPAATSVVILLVLRGIWRPHETIFAKPAGVCPNCGFDLRGLHDPGCPECGWGRDDVKSTTG